MRHEPQQNKAKFVTFYNIKITENAQMQSCQIVKISFTNWKLQETMMAIFCKNLSKRQIICQIDKKQG